MKGDNRESFAPFSDIFSNALTGSKYLLFSRAKKKSLKAPVQSCGFFDLESRRLAPDQSPTVLSPAMRVSL